MDTIITWLPVPLTVIGLYLVHLIFVHGMLNKIAERMVEARAPIALVNILCWSLVLIAVGCCMSAALVPSFFGPQGLESGMAVTWQGKDGIVVSQPGFWGSGGYEIRLADNTVVKVTRKEMTIKKTND